MNKQNKDTFEYLFNTYYKDLYVHALSFVRDEEEAKDIVTDVYEYVWRNFTRLDASVSLRPLLYTLTRSRSLDFLRREKSKEKFLAYQRTLPEAEEEYEEHEELLAKVMRVIENMPMQTATVFRKCFLEKKKYQEAGDELNISINTVRWHITKAMKLLRESLSGEEMVLLYVLFVKK
ncbi:sigma-70 family RNA polymerase sigma factor [Butyricimonas hominis]|uniref:sigma-70 family RNA polymerase sigma factor n=1 Tax=Butyricimonas TaxID=574697 RepID=UPI0035182ACB